jgi:hypothetical protein
MGPQTINHEDTMRNLSTIRALLACAVAASFGAALLTWT